MAITKCVGYMARNAWVLHVFSNGLKVFFFCILEHGYVTDK